MANFLKLMTRAKAGDPGAQYSLALMYRKGQGVRENNDIAMDWLRKVAEKGDQRALMFFEDLRC